MPSTQSGLSIVGQAALGGALGVSVVTNITLLILVVVLLNRGKGSLLSPSCSCDATRSTVQSGRETIDTEMKPNLVYFPTNESIMTHPNEVYGITSAEESTLSKDYECV